jgi:hypothetical protein
MKGQNKFLNIVIFAYFSRDINEEPMYAFSSLFKDSSFAILYLNALEFVWFSLFYPVYHAIGPKVFYYIFPFLLLFYLGGSF